MSSFEHFWVLWLWFHFQAENLPFLLLFNPCLPVPTLPGLIDNSTPVIWLFIAFLVVLKAFRFLVFVECHVILDQ